MSLRIDSDIDLFIQKRVLPQYQKIVNAFREQIDKDFPNIIEEMRGGTEKYFSIPVYRNIRIILSLSPTKNGITFSFSQGALFEDKYSLLQGEGNSVRNWRVKRIEDFHTELKSISNTVNG